ncbi:hypothetical protein ACFORG_15585 [Lutimaribacter marinistellae]|uniref:Uncharacterized protein n=1 Tax=Lutimaribacter marinistellae TaxID=1820329 RepID=A0ABV7THU2_9RHOB
MRRDETGNPRGRRAKLAATVMAFGWFGLWLVAYPFFVLAPKPTDPVSWVYPLGEAVRLAGIVLSCGAFVLEVLARLLGQKTSPANYLPFAFLILTSWYLIDEFIRKSVWGG